MLFINTAIISDRIVGAVNSCRNAENAIIAANFPLMLMSQLSIVLYVMFSVISSGLNYVTRLSTSSLSKMGVLWS